jgi:hypothetical protein
VQTVKNRTRHDTQALWELQRVLDRAIVRGHSVFYELMCRESIIAGEWEYLAAFRMRMSQAPPDEAAIRQSLRRRSLVVEEDGEWCLHVPLMARWLRQRG